MDKVYLYLGMAIFWMFWAFLGLVAVAWMIVVAREVFPGLDKFLHANRALFQKRKRIFFIIRRDAWARDSREIPYWMDELLREDNHKYRKHMLGITRRRRKSTLVNLIMQNYFSKDNG